jgi:hypothetical protein
MSGHFANYTSAGKAEREREFEAVAEAAAVSHGGAVAALAMEVARC